MSIQLLADIFITTKGRPELFGKSLRSFAENTDHSLYRLTIIDDTGRVSVKNETQEQIDSLINSDVNLCVDHFISHRENMGLGPSINQALAHIDSLKKWDGIAAPPLTVYLQDDVLYTDGWLTKLARWFAFYEKQCNLGFASGIESIEHPLKKDLGNGMILKNWIRATCMMARHEYWMSMYPISRIDPETGKERGKPNDGMGSSVDWWFIRNHSNSVCKTGKNNLVIPGLLQHEGYNRSTWLARELPESDFDKKIIANG